jgi:type I restriction enzyme M protein
MDQATHNKIVSFIWGIADDVLRDIFIRENIAMSF